MKIKRTMIATGTVTLFPFWAHAEATGGTESSSLVNVIYAVLPFIILGLLLFWFLRKVQSPKNPRIRKYDEHMQREVQHMQRVEENLERIIKLLEK